MDQTQPDDPKKAAEAMLLALEDEETPLRLLLGRDAVYNIRNKLDSVCAELARWEAVARNTKLEETTMRGVRAARRAA